ncbi:MAG: AAA family ATPase [Desulfobacteraceae bacterium]|nr:AAA family ATPase [Desulfobacteraceae bacterium]
MPKIIATGGGKGGVGKSFFSANAGGLLSMVGKRTLLIDLDTGGPNLHSFFGITNPKTGLNDFLSQKSSIEECILETKFERLFILNSKNCSTDLGNIPFSMRNLLQKEIKKLRYDYIIIDLGAGTNRYLIDFFLIADFPIVLFTTDPLSLENSFRFVHKVFIHKIMESVPYKKLSGFLTEGSSVRPVEILERLFNEKSTYYEDLKTNFDKFKLYLAASQTENSSEAIKNIVSFYKKFFGENITFTGSVPFNAEAKSFISQRKLFVSGPKNNATVKGLMEIVKFLL